MNQDLTQKIEAILFYVAEPVAISFIAKTLEVLEEEILSGLEELKTTLAERGVRLIVHNNDAALVTAPELSSLIERIIKEERERDLGRAGIETLAIIAYKGFVTKKEIEYIRGVNSQYALRNLLLRGLVERKADKHDERMVGYSITADTLRHLGLGSITELPEYEAFQKQLEVVEEKEEALEETE